MDKNEKLYKLYRPFSYDYLFYTAIIFLFATITKGLTVGQFMYICSIYSIFFAIFQIPVNYVVELLGLKKSMILGNIFCIVHLVIYIFATKFHFFAVAEVFCALGFSLKGLTETQLLYKSLKANGKGSKYAKMEGKSVSRYYYLEAIGSLFMGYLFSINSYIPIISTLVTVVIALIIAFQFNDIDVTFSDSEQTVKHYIKDLKKVLRSRRVAMLFIYAFFVTGFVEVIKVIQKSALVELDVKPTMYTIIIAVFTLAVGIGSRIANRFEKITKRKTLTVIGLNLTLLIVDLGLILLYLDNADYKLYFSIIVLFIYNIYQGIYRMSIKRYLNNFTTSIVRGKILAIFYIFEGIGRALLLFISGSIIDGLRTSYTCIILGAVILIIVVLIIKLMKKKLGLDPKEYTKDDLFGKTPSELTK